MSEIFHPSHSRYNTRMATLKLNLPFRQSCLGQKTISYLGPNTWNNAGINFIQNHPPPGQTPGTRLEGSKNPPPGTIIVYKNPSPGTKQGVKSPTPGT